MQRHAPPASAETRPLWVVVLAAGTDRRRRHGPAPGHGPLPAAGDRDAQDRRRAVLHLHGGRQPDLGYRRRIRGHGRRPLRRRPRGGRRHAGNHRRLLPHVCGPHAVRPDGERRAVRHRRQRHGDHRAGGGGRPRRAARQAHRRHRVARHGRRDRRVRCVSLHPSADGPHRLADEPAAAGRDDGSSFCRWPGR